MGELGWNPSICCSSGCDSYIYFGRKKNNKSDINMKIRGNKKNDQINIMLITNFRWIFLTNLVFAKIQ